MTSRADVVGALTVLVQTIRPAWDTRAIRPVIEQLTADGRDLADLAHAAIRAAQDPAIRRPAGIAFDQHWRPTIRDTETAEERDARLQQQADAAAERASTRAQRDAEQRAEIAARHAAVIRADLAERLAQRRNHQEQP